MSTPCGQYTTPQPPATDLSTRNPIFDDVLQGEMYHITRYHNPPAPLLSIVNPPIPNTTISATAINDIDVIQAPVTRTTTSFLIFTPDAANNDIIQASVPIVPLLLPDNNDIMQTRSKSSISKPKVFLAVSEPTFVYEAL
ncbi:hypothetical protein PanWU01x14_014420 [Parasponia andersonii]|uniref:Uncharacterized protein n=1 Tax=Parasponia andersonii TaxID=3476 RepID=A0A2P5E070_PARAD|nr:hypothetical protein PanWU01x14_014420 [Parasponia andersonii]